MYKIGEFSVKTGATTKTLRYYDIIGLLKPSMIDSFTNYRYYTEKQVQIYKRIEYLKTLGFTLDEIKMNLDNISLEFLDAKRQELEDKRDYISKQIDEIIELKRDLVKDKIKKIG